MKKYFLWSIVLILTFPSLGKAATPTISSVSGTVATGQTLTITGTNMVNETTANWSWSLNTSHFAGANYSADGYVCSSAGTGCPYVASPNLLGGHSLESTPVPGGGATCITGEKYYMDRVYTNVSGLGHAYARFYYRYNSGMGDVFANTQYIKHGMWEASSGILMEYHYLSGWPSALRYGNVGAPPATYSLPATLQADRWYCFELESDAVNNVQRIWIDGVLLGTSNQAANVTYNKWLTVPNTNSCTNSGTVPSGGKIYTDGFVQSSSRVYPASTIEISNSATYHAGTYRYQHPVSLTDTSIQIVADLTGLGSGPYFLHVTNNNQEHTVTPYNLSGEPGGVDVTDPVTTNSPSAGAYVTGSTITLTCADNVACGTTYYCWGASCTPTTAYSTPITITADTLRFYSTDSSSNTEDVKSAVYTILVGDTTPPVVSVVSPSGTLAYGTTSTVMQVTTNENATCKYNTSDVAYASMSNTFSTTGAASHSQTLSSLTNGAAYTYYVRCTDGTNPNTSSSVVSFSVSSTAPTSNRLFSESFEDTNIAARGWYDNTNHGTVVAGGQSGNALQWAWTSGQTKPTNGNAARKQFTPTDELYISFYVKFATGWRGSQQNYHPHLIHIMSDLDPQYGALADSYLDTYIEFLSDVGSPYEIRPQIAIQDSLRVNSGLGTPPVDLSSTTETRSVTYCNTPVPTGATGTCYDSGGWYTANTWTDGTTDVSTNTWHHVEAYFKMNTISGGVGQSNGIIKMWIDDDLLIDHSDVLFRTNQDATKKWAQFILAPYIGDTSPITQTMWIDELEVYDGLPSNDNYPPSVTNFTVPAKSDRFLVSISGLTGSDDVGVTGYKVTQSATPPLAGDSGWTETAPTTVTAAGRGTQTFYAWTKDATGNVSAAYSAQSTNVVVPYYLGVDLPGMKGRY